MKYLLTVLMLVLITSCDFSGGAGQTTEDSNSSTSPWAKPIPKSYGGYPASTKRLKSRTYEVKYKEFVEAFLENYKDIELRKSRNNSTAAIRAVDEDIERLRNDYNAMKQLDSIGELIIRNNARHYALRQINIEFGDSISIHFKTKHAD